MHLHSLVAAIRSTHRAQKVNLEQRRLMPPPIARIISLLTVLSLSSSYISNVHGQKFERFSNKEGFNQNTINDIEQDAYGMLWFGTSNGLIKYDGYDFTNYTSEASDESSISHNLIKDLYTDANETMWIGTRESLEVYLPSLKKFFQVPLSETLNVFQISSDKAGNIWFAGQNKLYVCRIENINEGQFKLSENLIEENANVGFINKFYLVDSTSLLIGTDTGLYHTAIEKSASGWPEISSISAIPDFLNHQITALEKIQDIYWVGTSKGLFKASLEGERMHLIHQFENKVNKIAQNTTLEIRSIFEDKEGSVWVGTRTDGLLKYLPETDEFTLYSFNPKNKGGISSKSVNVVFQDDFNVLWFGTAQGGINKLDLTQKPFNSYSNNPYNPYSISDNLVNAILEDNEGKLWVAGFNGSLCRSIESVDESTVGKLRFENLESSIKFRDKEHIKSIFQDDKGFIWIGTNKSLIVFNPSTNDFRRLTLYDKDKILPDQHYNSTIQLNNGHLLLIGPKLIILDNPWNKVINNKRPNVQVHSILNIALDMAMTQYLDSKDRIWIGTHYTGLYQLQLDSTGKIKEMTPPSIGGESAKLSSQSVFSLYEDKQQNLWIGTFGGGINKLTFNEKGEAADIKYFRKSRDLPDDAIYGIIPEGEDYLWISTDMGLLRFMTSDHTYEVFDVRDGITQNNFRLGAYFKGRSGYYYYGGLNGLVLFRPEYIKSNEQAPVLMITDLLVNNRKVNIGEELNGRVVLEQSIAESKKIRLSQKQRIVGFDLLVEHTSMPSKNKIAYKLDGFNDEWVEEATGKTTITYTNLSAGTYTLMVKGANGDGKWSEKVLSLVIEILPPWHQTWWSYLLFSILTIGICGGVFVYFIQHERLKQKLKYEELDRLRTETINQGKLRYFTNLSHEFKTPLTLISGPLEHVKAKNTDPSDKKYLAIIEKNTKRLINLVDQLITFRKAEQGHVNLNLSKKTLGEFIYPITEAFETYALEKNINFYYKIGTPNENTVIDIEKLERIIFNLLSNAFKFTPALGSIGIETEVKLVNNKKTIVIEVIDSGKGIPKEELANIFERFYQLGDQSDSVSGGGIGLAFCKSMIHLLGGEISAKSNPGVETCFSVSLPSRSMKEVDSEIVKSSTKSYISDWVPLSTDLTENYADKREVNDQKKHNILIVENEIDVLTFLKSTFSEKYNITTAKNGIEALEKLEQREPELVISDVMMPEMDGYELCQKIKENPDLGHISVLLLTALGEKESLIKGLEYGADEYISKPFSIKHLELSVDKLIENKIRLRNYFASNSTLPTKDIGISAKDKEFLSQTIELIEKHMKDSNFGVQELAFESRMSSSHLYRRLKQLTGQSPNVYIRNFRLRRAAELMNSNSGYNVTEIMYQIGIESNSYFSTSFKKLHGISPSEFLKRKTKYTT